MKKIITLAHYYTTPEVQAMADRVGDSLDLSRYAAENKADRIVFAGVKFMAETAKILNPDAEVILPDEGSTCSLVTQPENIRTSVKDSTPALYSTLVLLNAVQEAYGKKQTKVITYINSSVELKALSDIIVTSANVEDVVENTIAAGYKVFFTPDRNMGAYLASQHPEWGDLFDYYKDAVCEVHEKFKADELNWQLKRWSNYGKYVLAHPESPLAVLEQANYVGSTRGMLKWVEEFPYEFGNIYVATEEGLLYNMRKLRPKLNIQLAPTYSGCQCNSCPYMKKNTSESVTRAQNGIGFKINYINEDLRLKAKKPIDEMLNENWRILK